MPAIERVGEIAIHAIERLYYYALGLIIRIINLSRKLQQWDREKVLPLFRGKEMRDYMVLKLQLSIFAFFIVVVGDAFGFLPPKVSLPLSAIAGLYSLYSILYQLGRYMERDYMAYRNFFLGYIAISLLIYLFNLFLEEGVYLRYVYLIFFTLVVVGGFSYLFKSLYGRDYTYGVVEEGGEPAVVRFSYDLLSGVKAGKVILENSLEAGEGQVVKVRVEKGFFNIRGSRPVEMEGEGSEGQ